MYVILVSLHGSLSVELKVGLGGAVDFRENVEICLGNWDGW